MNAITDIFRSKQTTSPLAAGAQYNRDGTLMTPPVTGSKPTDTSAVLASAPTPSGSVAVPGVTPAAEMPTANSAATIAAGNSAANTIAQRAGRTSTRLTSNKPRPAKTLAASGGNDSPYTAKTLG